MKEIEQEQLSGCRVLMYHLVPPYAFRLAAFVLRKIRWSNLAKPGYFTNRVLTGERYEIGDYTYGVPAVFPYFSHTRLKIGKYCSIAGQVSILLGGNHRVHWVTTYPFTYFLDEWPEANGMPIHATSEGDVVIGNDVWIGQAAFILSGVTIGDGAVIGARAVVTRDVEPYSIVAGNPARLIRKRFDDKTIERLLDIRWWDWPVEKIKKNLHLICSNNLEELLSLEG
jgi:acetyltransferase-like isoleucine patch superfamily enzyme